MKGNEKLIITEDSIKLSESNEKTAVMHKGEKPLMEKLAEIVTKNGGDILEIGFGMHLSADAIQSKPNITSHTIIEVHPEIYRNALTWAENKPNTTILFGNWVDILPLNGKVFDGILHDTHLDYNIPDFLNKVKDNCKKGSIVGFFEYPLFDTRLNGVRFTINEDNFNTLPYKDNKVFKRNQFELKYTTFNGTEFYAENIKSALV